MVCAMRARLNGEVGLLDAYLRGDKTTMRQVAATRRSWLSLHERRWVRDLLYGINPWGGDEENEGNL